MRQLANGLMGNEGASAGNWWLDTELHSIYRIHGVLYTCNMLLSKCDSVSLAKCTTPNLPFDIKCCETWLWIGCSFRQKHALCRPCTWAPPEMCQTLHIQSCICTMSSSYYCVNDFETHSCGDAATGAVQSALTVQRWRQAWLLTPLHSAVLSVQMGIFFYSRSGPHCSFISKHLLGSSGWPSFSHFGDFFFAIFVLYIWCTLLILINSDWQQAYLPVSGQPKHARESLKNFYGTKRFSQHMSMSDSWPKGQA